MVNVSISEIDEHFVSLYKGTKIIKMEYNSDEILDSNKICAILNNPECTFNIIIETNCDIKFTNLDKIKDLINLWKWDKTFNPTMENNINNKNIDLMNELLDIEYPFYVKHKNIMKGNMNMKIEYVKVENENIFSKFVKSFFSCIN